MWVGFGMIIFGFFGAVYNFSKVVKKIDKNIKTQGTRSMFQLDTYEDALEGTRRELNSQSAIEAFVSRETSSSAPKTAYAESPKRVVEQIRADTQNLRAEAQAVAAAAQAARSAAAQEARSAAELAKAAEVPDPSDAQQRTTAFSS
jgi:hypothetical protein